jgi:two-component system, OmpR family, copper resistance phosphate regulon response regulator CusR
MKVLLIDDEQKIALALAKGLEENGLEVDTAFEVESALELIKVNNYDIIVSDVVMPKYSGIDLVNSIRKLSIQTPIIIVSALDQLEDKVAGFEAGADDYLTKPFEFIELLFRIKALARRPVGTFQFSKSLVYQSLSMNLETNEFYREDKKIELTPREFSLMEFFMRNSEKTITKFEIAEKVWKLNFDTGTNYIEVYVNFLRKKIESGFDKKILHTQYKVGYILRED